MMNTDLAEVEEGSVEFRCRPDESHDNTLGRVHGGFVCTVLDSAAGCAVRSTLPAGVGCTSLDLSVGYLRGVHLDSGELLAVGTVVKPGRRIAFAQATVTDSEGRAVATATSTLLVFPVAEAAGRRPTGQSKSVLRPSCSHSSASAPSASSAARNASCASLPSRRSDGVDSDSTTRISAAAARSGSPACVPCAVSTSLRLRPAVSA
jgi:uncharacterized protein (TIGR00369 family)